MEHVPGWEGRGVAAGEGPVYSSILYRSFHPLITPIITSIKRCNKNLFVAHDLCYSAPHPLNCPFYFFIEVRCGVVIFCLVVVIVCSIILGVIPTGWCTWTLTRVIYTGFF